MICDIDASHNPNATTPMAIQLLRRIDWVADCCIFCFMPNVEVWHRLQAAPLRLWVKCCSYLNHSNSERVGGCPGPLCSAIIFFDWSHIPLPKPSFISSFFDLSFRLQEIILWGLRGQKEVNRKSKEVQCAQNNCPTNFVCLVHVRRSEMGH